MKKTAIFASVLAALMLFTGCSPKSYQQIKSFKEYVSLGEYKGLSYTAPTVTVTDYEVQIAVNKKLNDSGYVTYQDDLELKEGTVRIGDTVNINYKGLKDGVAFEGGTAEKQSLTIGSGSFIAGFEEGLVGKAIGSDVSLNLTFPEDYHSADLAGKAVVFEVKINSVTKRANYKELTDDIAHLLNKDVNTAAEFTAAVRTELENQKKAAEENEIKNDFWTTVVDSANFKKDIPKSLLEKPTEEFKDYYKKLATQYGYDDISSFLKANNISSSDFNDTAKKYAKDTVKSDMVAFAIAEAEGYSPTEEEIRKTAEKYASANGYADVDKYIDAIGKDGARALHMTEYAVELIFSNATAK